MKKLVMVLATAFAAAMPLMAETATVDGVEWTYTVSGGEVEIYNSGSPAIPTSTTGAITIPSTLGGYPVTSIGHDAFYRCSGLTSVTIPDTVTSIGGNAFYLCIGLTSVTIGNGVTNVGNDPFYGCYNIREVTVPGWKCGIDFGNVTKLVIGAGATVIREGAFAYCNSLTSVTIPDSVTSIGRGAFDNCSGLTSVTIPDSVTSIGQTAFYGCSGLTSVTIPDSVTSIGNSAFYDCSGLTSVTIGNGVTNIGNDPFYGCYNIREVTVPGWKCGIDFGNVTILVITPGTTSIGANAFSGCSSLTSVTIPDSLTSIGDNAFEECSGLTGVHISDLAAWCEISFGTPHSNPLSYAQNLYLNGERITELTIPNSLTIIGQYVFRGCSCLTSVTIPDSVTGIGQYAFSSCSGLTHVTIPSSVTSIGQSAFSSCNGLTHVTIPSSVTSIGQYAFYGCSGLTSVTIGNGVTYIGLCAFSDCRGLTSVTIPDSVTSIGGSAFYGCSRLTSVTIGSGVTRIGSMAFDYCRSLNSVTMCGNSPSVDSSAFLDAAMNGGVVRLPLWNETYTVKDGEWQGLTVRYYGQDLTIDSDGVLTSVHLYDVTEVDIPGSVTSIGDYAFSGCNGLVSVTIPDSVVNIGEYAFYCCKSLKSVSLPRRLRGKLADNVFEGCPNDLMITYRSTTNSVMFDANGGKFSDGKTVRYVEAMSGNLWGKLPMPLLSGQVFDGYYTAKDGGEMATASDEVPYFSTTYYARWTPRLGLAAASEWSGEFQTDSWCGQGTVSRDGRDALRSGIVYDGQNSYLMTKVTGSGILSFWWAVSCEAGGKDALRLLVDGNQFVMISGDVDWTKVEVPITGPGTHTVKWNYTKNGSVTKGEDFGWVDQIGWTAATVEETFVFDANGGKFSNGAAVKKTDATPGNLWGKMYMPAKDGEVFVGWYTAKEGGELVTSSSTMPYYYCTYYARWAPRLGLAAASEWSREFTTDSWCGQGAVSHDGRDALRSGIVYDGQSSYLITRVTDGGTLTFWWKVSCEAGGKDALRLLVDGVQVQMISGETDWTKVTVNLTGSGTHVIKWNYTKNGSVTKGQDFGWIDQIEWKANKVQLWDGGPYWATTNIGAEKPEDCGYYFWWGDTVGYKWENEQWVASDGSESGFSFSPDNTPTDGKSMATLRSEGWITADNVFVPEHDAAQVQWGGNWRMPTYQELDDLNSKCDWTWTTVNGVNGYVVRGRDDYSSASIFLPCAGYGYGTSLKAAGSLGAYWSSVPHSVGGYAYGLFFSSDSHNMAGYHNYRLEGQSVRPVQGFTK